MRRINHKDLQLSIEKELFRRIKKSLHQQGVSNKYFSKSCYDRDKLILPGQAIEVGGHYNVNYILNRIENVFKPDIRVRIFLYQSVVFNISCFEYVVDEDLELHIYVSQHFFNNLNEEEQIGIIGHEISHYIYGHLGYQMKELLSDPYILRAEANLKSNLIYWNKVCEITADIMGLLAIDFNHKSYSTAIIKHFTGLNESTISSFNVLPLINLGLEQYNQFANDPLFNDVASTHPSMMLRLKVVNTIPQFKLIRNFNQIHSVNEINDFKKEYNSTINELIEAIYPELFPDKKGWDQILVPMTIAVILSDGEIDEKEIKYFEDLFLHRSPRLISKYKKILLHDKVGFKELVETFINDSIAFAGNHGYNKHKLVPIIRKLLLVADSDGQIDKRELECIYKFGKAFGFTREDIVIMVQTQYRLSF
jgi:hypothetical protein